jgi:hypothetical protein
MTTHTPTAAAGLDARLREPWTVSDELARLVAREHCRDPRTGRCVACGYRPTSTRFPVCRSHVVARALYQHSAVKDLPPIEDQTPAGADAPATEQLALFAAEPNPKGRTRA